MLDSADAYGNHFSLDPVCEEVAHLAWFLDGSDDDGRGTYVNVDLMTFPCVQVAGEELGVELGEVQPPPAGEALTMQVDGYSWSLLTGDTAALVMIDTDDEALIPHIIDSLEYVGWETLLHHTEGYGF